MTCKILANGVLFPKFANLFARQSFPMYGNLELWSRGKVV